MTDQAIAFPRGTLQDAAVDQGETMAKTPEKKTVYRDSKDGQFTTKKDAEKNPSTTEKERVPVGKPGPKKK